MGAAGIPLRELGLVLLVAAVVTFLVTGAIRSVMVRSGRIAEVRARDVHTQPTPRLGGVAMFSGFFACCRAGNAIACPESRIYAGDSRNDSSALVSVRDCAGWRTRRFV